MERRGHERAWRGRGATRRRTPADEVRAVRALRARRAAGRLLVALALCALCTLTGAAAVEPATLPARPAENYAVIAHPLVTSSGVSLAQLRALFRGARRTWDDGTRVVLVVQAAGSRTRAFVLRELYQMDEAAFKRYWIARTFESGGGPTLVSGDAMARRLVGSIPGAVAVVPAAAVDSGVRVLRVDGRLPGAEGYPLTAPPAAAASPPAPGAP